MEFIIAIALILGLGVIVIDWLGKKNDEYCDRKYNSNEAIKARIASQMGMSKFLKETKAI